jgi:cobalt-zinc-cadmium efflux system membrane fusion protein
MKETIERVIAGLSSRTWVLGGIAAGLIILVAGLLVLTRETGDGGVARRAAPERAMAEKQAESAAQDGHDHASGAAHDDHGVPAEGHATHDHAETVLAGACKDTGVADAHDHEHDHAMAAAGGDHGHEEHAGDQAHDPHGHGGHGHGEEGFERGPNNGRLLKGDGGPLSLEITIFEAGRPPQFRIYPYLEGEPVDPSTVDLTVELGRLGGKTDTFAFKPEGAYLAGDSVVSEPHSFDVSVHANQGGQAYDWSYPSYEGRTEISAEAARAAGVATECTGRAELSETIDALGRIKFAPGAKVTLRARFPGPVTEVLKTVGDAVQQGETLARVESNESMQAYDIVSPIDGVVLERLTNAGDLATDKPLMVVGDLTRLHVDFHIFASDQNLVSPGQEVLVEAVNGSMRAQTKVAAILPTREAATQTIIARAPLANPDGNWVPGMTAKGTIVVAEKEVPLAVKTKALQRFRDFTVVFAKVGDTYEVRMLELGRRTPEWTEVLGGIAPGEEYVVENSFLIKADIEKSGAAHDH